MNTSCLSYALKSFTFSTVKLLWMGLIFTMNNVYSQSTVSILSESKIKISHWKYGRNASVNLSFDDNEKNHLLVSQIFDEYNFKATFFVNYAATSVLYDEYKDILKRGHEIGNHGASHLDLTLLDSASIINEVNQEKIRLEYAFNYKCFSFAAPFNNLNALSLKIVSASHFFIRDCSFYAPLNHKGFGFLSKTTLDSYQNSLKLANLDSSMYLVLAHSVDGDGWQPTTSQFLRQVLTFLKAKSDLGIVWVSTFSDISLYERLYKEVKMVKNVLGDTIKLRFLKFDSLKYAKFDSCMLSVDVITNNGIKYQYLTKGVEVNHLRIKDVLTFDLKKIKDIVIVRSMSVNTNFDTVHMLVGQSFRYNIILSSNKLKDTICSYRLNLAYNPAKFTFQSIDFDSSRCFYNMNRIDTNNGNISFIFPSVKCKVDSQFAVSLAFLSIDSTTNAPYIENAILNKDSILFANNQYFVSDYLIGDVNGDLKIDSTDSQVILNYCVHRDSSISPVPIIWESWRIKIANYNNDEFLNSYDAYDIMKSKSFKTIIESNSLNNEDTIKAFLNNDTIYFYTKTPLYSFNLISNSSYGLKKPILPNNYALNAINTDNASIAFATLTPFIDEVFLKIPVGKNNYFNYRFEGFQNNKFYSIENIERNKTIDNIFIYPNPATNIVYFEVPNSLIHLSIKVFNNLGKLLFVSSNHQLDISGYPKGIYFIKFSNGKYNVTKKLIKL